MRIAPQDPEDSFASTRAWPNAGRAKLPGGTPEEVVGLDEMPQLGTEVVDMDGLAAVAAWIESLAP